MKRQQNTPGAIVEIPINEGEYCAYAQILTNSNFVFFDYRSKEHLTDLTILLDAPVLFFTAVYRDVVSQGVKS